MGGIRGGKTPLVEKTRQLTSRFPGRFCACLLLITSALPLRADWTPPLVTDQRLEGLGLRLLQNETGGRNDRLVWWNQGEDFASLGIGHFIWYPAGRPGPFQESFPDLLRFLAGEGISIPAWLSGARPSCPWPDRETFLTELDSPRTVQLREWLRETFVPQTRYIVHRLNGSMPSLLAAASPDERHVLEQRITGLAGSTEGFFALIDYRNFKGDGTVAAERYRGQGWGLLQVLEAMEGRDDPLEDFVGAAIEVLTRRVANAPPERHEERWLPGWIRRVRGYTADRALSTVDGK